MAAIDLIRTADSQGRRKVLMLEAQTVDRGNVEMVMPINKAIIDAISAGVVVCVAAGNRGDDANIGDDMRPIRPRDRSWSGLLSTTQIRQSTGVTAATLAQCDGLCAGRYVPRRNL